MKIKLINGHVVKLLIAQPVIWLTFWKFRKSCFNLCSIEVAKLLVRKLITFDNKCQVLKLIYTHKGRDCVSVY